MIRVSNRCPHRIFNKPCLRGHAPVRCLLDLFCLCVHTCESLFICVPTYLVLALPCAICSLPRSSCSFYTPQHHPRITSSATFIPIPATPLLPALTSLRTLMRLAWSLPVRLSVSAMASSCFRSYSACSRRRSSSRRAEVSMRMRCSGVCSTSFFSPPGPAHRHPKGHRHVSVISGVKA